MINPFRRSRKGNQHAPIEDIVWSTPLDGSIASNARKSLQELVETTKQFDHVEHLDTKRAEIALKFVNWYLLYVAVIIIGVPIFNVYSAGSHEPIDIYKLLGQLGTLLGSPLGFVVGYYFKEDSKQQ